MNQYTYQGKPLEVIKIDEELSVVVDKDAEIAMGDSYVAYGNYPDKVKLNVCSDKYFENPDSLRVENKVHNTGHWKIITTIGTRRLDGVPCIEKFKAVWTDHDLLRGIEFAIEYKKLLKQYHEQSAWGKYHALYDKSQIGYAIEKLKELNSTHNLTPADLEKDIIYL